ncbi:DUF4976 domain-containing protein [Puteibacter caeruleilacunae]|nr:DUF4976 domain-containing protein [Puteibacter caeruleilacunae]
MLRKISSLTTFGLALLASATSSCTSTTTQQVQPNILLIVSEDNGPDLGCYGNKDVTTPNLDQLANHGVMFNKASVTYSVCSPSRSTIFTGLYPHQNGQIGLATHKYRMYKNFETLPRILKQHGYRTGCLGKIHVNPEAAIPFDFHPIKGSNFAKKDLPQYAIEAEKFTTQSDQPFFLMVNFPDAHFPVQKQVQGMPAKPISSEDLEHTIDFTGADSKRLREFTANYYNCMNRLDESIGMLLTKLEKANKLDNTLIIYLGDHGAQFSRGKCSNYEAALRIPFIMQWEGQIKAGTINNNLISTIDIVPTILDAANIQGSNSLPGKSLLEVANTSYKKNWRDAVYAGGAGASSLMYYPRRSVRTERFKLIHNILQDRDNPHYHFYLSKQGHFAAGTQPSEITNASDQIKNAYKTWKNPPEYELYDLDNDPLEWKNLANDPQYASTLEQLKSKLTTWQLTTNDPFADPKKLDMFTKEVDRINEVYPNHSYKRDKNFKWEYPNYFSK